MTTEFEAKILNIDPDEIRSKLKKLGAHLVFPEKTFERWNFDFENKSLDAKRGWLRLREGEPDGRWTLAYKQFDGARVDGVKEVEVDIGSKDQMLILLSALGLEIKSHQQRKREQWRFGSIEIDIDTWPWIPTFLEIEGASEQEVRDYCEKLELDFSKAIFGAANHVYDVYGILDVNHIKELTFEVNPPRSTRD